MKRSFTINIWSVLLLTVLFLACNKITVIEIPIIPDNGEIVNVSLKLSVKQLDAGTAHARENGITTRTTTSYEPSVVIKNLWVIQLNGIVDGSKVINTQYIDDIEINETPNITLLPSTVENKIIYIANTFNRDLGVKLGMTLAEVKNIGWEITKESQVLMVDPDDNTSVPDTEHYFTLNGSQNLKVIENALLNADLSRNVAKIVIKVKNSCAGMTITSLTLRDVPTKSYYFTNREDLHDIYPAKLSTFGYLKKDIGNSTINTSNSYTFYVPVNKRGAEPMGSVPPQSKPLFAPMNSTYATVAISHADGTFWRYTFYLGANLTDNFNIEANKEYSYVFDFKGKGDIKNDLRIEDLGSVDYTDPGRYDASNCYIINPIDEADRVYYIPIESRINNFWSRYAGEGVKIDNIEDWDLDMMWYDCDSNPLTSEKSITIEKAVGKSQQAFMVTVPAGFSNVGNVVIAIKERAKDGVVTNNILWSWHLWITDYNPNSRKHNPQYIAATYPVAGGNIHSYEDVEFQTPAIWGKGGIYQNKFIMDRNLGARSVDSDRKDVLLYQFGRKDPFPGDQGQFMDRYGSSGTEPKKSRTIFGVSFTDAIKNPTTFYYSSWNWCRESDANNSKYLWNDKNVDNNTSNPILSSVKKSIFDPSPLGWRLPIHGTWNDFDNNNDNNFTWDGRGRSYKELAYYPATGLRSSNTGLFNSMSTCGHYWSSSSCNIQGYSLYFISANVDTNLASSRANGFSVRSIQE